MPYLLGIDNGGTMTKAAVFDHHGTEIAVCAQSTPLLCPQPGFYERDMTGMWEITAACIRAAIGKAGISAGKIIGVGCTGHGKGLYLWGKDGRPAYNGIASTDKRAQEIINEWNSDKTAQMAQQMTLQPILACQPAALLKWIKKFYPEILQNTQWIFEAKDYIRFMLTGEPRAEITDYSGTCLLNLHTGNFDLELLHLFGIDDLYDKLPKLCLSDDICGTVTEQAESLTGLLQGTPVCAGMFDIDACALAMGVTTPEQMCTISGTWSINEYVSTVPVPSGKTTRNSLFCIPGAFLIEESSPTSAGNLDWFLRNFMKSEKKQAELAGENLYKKAEELVNSLLPQDSEVIFLPFLYGCPSGIPVEAAFIDLSDAHCEAHMLRAIFEGVAFSHLQHIERLLNFRTPPKTICLAGGAARSDVWTQMFSDIFGIPVEVVSAKELGALGSAMAAAVAVGLYSDYREAADKMVSVCRTVIPNAECTEIYRKKYQKYRKLITLLEALEESSYAGKS